MIQIYITEFLAELLFTVWEGLGDHLRPWQLHNWFPHHTIPIIPSAAAYHFNKLSPLAVIKYDWQWWQEASIFPATMMKWSYHLLSNNDGMKLSSSQQQWWRQAFIFSATMMTWSFYLLSNKDGIQQKPLLPCYSWDWLSCCFSSLSGKKSQIPTALTIPMPSHDVILLFNLQKYSRNLLFFCINRFCKINSGFCHDEFLSHIRIQ